jgi:hypothetical protein
MAKRKKVVEQYDGAIYGIDRHGEVGRIAVYRKGSSVRMSRMWPDMRTYDHHVTLPGRSARSEAVVVYEFHDLFEVSPGLENSDHVKQELKKLEEKAEKYRAEIAAAAAKKNETPNGS